MNTEADEIEQARLRLTTIPELSGSAATAKITRLGGMTNLVFRVDVADESLCLRLPGKGTEAYIDRRVEETNARAAAKAGIAPEVICFRPDGVMVTRYVEGARTMSPTAFREADAAVERAGLAFRRLHDAAPDFAFRFELFRMIDDYLGVLDRLGATLPEGYHEAVAEAGAVRDALGKHPVRPRPCHCDPLCENFLDTGDRMWIVDWEYSGMNDPMWDLGDLSVEGGFDAAQDARLLRAYFGRPASPFDHGRMVVYKAMCDLLWTLWGLIQHANGNPAEDFWAYATNRFERCKTLMRGRDFASHMAAVRQG